MLTGIELGQAIAKAIKLKIASGAARSKKEIAEHFGVQPPTIHDWINRGTIRKDNLDKAMVYFSDVVGPEHWDLKSFQAPAENDDHAGVKMIDAKASAGQGSLVFSTDVLKTLMFRRDFLAKNGAKPEDVIAFPVKGDSMVDAHITDGSVVIANLKKTEPLSKRFYVLWLDGELFVKQLVQKGGRWYARSHNQAKDYPDIEIDIDDRIVGRAFWCGFSL